ncbi:peptidyl-prolyl cis-trans isomerase, cyclophilin-type family protein [Reticulomyxa filosa]|uniref:Peptidyl-prolyl cis-trans isomerase n=1 Tax=Reticulomyxa filosa TaxID=46433 RepID=X6LFT6_RETFI|nr:peptidyl-prolyl cis-trans isomerase, cyclophilin-type family protein [Reticulomyxa filosa]|eukprot:ETO00404.1 peptidyl-prolyl cis-trans isomerase, cyclophilin-type family protein [Reticulomyxa filosa]
MSLTLQTTLGELKLELFCELTPKAAKVLNLIVNFLGLSASGFYDGTIFHRNIKGFMIQGGAPKNSKNYRGGKSIYNGEYFEDEIIETLKFDRKGVVAMANQGPNTNTSQFFITYKEASHLNNTCTIFGKVIYGMHTLDAMEKIDTDEKNRPVDPIHILSVTIHSNPVAEKELVIK